MVTAERLIEDWLRSQNLEVVRVDLSSWKPAWAVIMPESRVKKWKANQWRFYLYPDLVFTAYNVHKCSYMQVSLKVPESIDQISNWIKENEPS